MNQENGNGQYNTNQGINVNNNVVQPGSSLGQTPVSQPVANNSFVAGKEDMNVLNRPPESLIVNPTQVVKAQPVTNGNMVVEQGNNNVNKLSPSFMINMIVDIFKKPVEFVNDVVKKYGSKSNSLMLFIFFTIFSVILSLATGVITGGFVKTYDFNSGSVTSNYNFSYVFNHNFLNDIIVGFVSSGLLIVLVSLSYFILCYFKKTKNDFFSILTLTTACYGPLVLGVNVIYPIISVFQVYVALILAFVLIIFTLVVHITTLNSLIHFNKPNDPIYFHVISLGIAFAFVLILAVIFLHDNISAISYGISIGM